MYPLQNFQSGSCAIGIVMWDENGGRERGGKKKRCAQFATHVNFSLLHLHIIDSLSGSLILCGLNTTRLPKPK